MKRLHFSWKYAAIISGIVLLAYLLMDFNSRMASLRELTVQREIVATQVSGMEQTRSRMETQIAYATSESAVAQWAYEEGQMVRPGDIPAVPLPDSQSTPIVQPTPIVTRPVVENWQVWLWLFFDTR